MDLGETVAVTGCAGFIGSNLTERLLEMGIRVVGLDNLSRGRRENLPSNSGGFEFINADLTEEGRWQEKVAACDTVFHLAAHSEAGGGDTDTMIHLKQNVIATRNVLEASLKKGKQLVFASTSTVYGEATVLPTPENYGPAKPIGMYGASKLACEGYIAAYSHVFDAQSVIYRFANAVGRRGTHGVTHDLIRKLMKNPRELEIIGREPGTRKSYIHIDDLMDGMLSGLQKTNERVDIFNLGTEQTTTVKEIAEIVVDVMGLHGVRFKWTGGVDDGRGWKEDVRHMMLSIDRLKSLGWRPRLSSSEAVRKAAMELVEEFKR